MPSALGPRWTALPAIPRGKLALFKADERGSVALSGANVKLRGHEEVAPEADVGGLMAGVEALHPMVREAVNWCPVIWQHCNFCRPAPRRLHFFQFNLGLVLQQTPTQNDPRPLPGMAIWI